jgi:hypothetical protein
MKKFNIELWCEEWKSPMCMPVEPMDGDLDAMIEPDQVVHTGEKTITIQYDYPLSSEVNLSFNHPEGKTEWTRKQVFDAIQKGYNEIYDQEELALDTDKEPPFGIWGHCIYDLVIEEVSMNKKGILELSIGS